VLELSGEEHRDDYFVNSSLNEDNCDQSKNCMGDVPKLEEPEELEEGHRTDEAGYMSNGGHDGTELRATRFEHGAEEQRHQEKNEKYCGVPHHRSNGDEEDTNQTAWGLLSSLWVGERFDKHICYDEDECKRDWREHFGEEHGPPTSTWHITHKLLGRVSQLLLLIASDHRPR